MSEVCFVYGSNLKGLHGAGAASFAHQHYGAVMGQGVGRHGMSYGIPTKDRELKVLPLSVIRQHVEYFVGYVKAHADELFYVTAVGCGLAGYSAAEIAPMFVGTVGLDNVSLPVEFLEILDGKKSAA